MSKADEQKLKEERRIASIRERMALLRRLPSEQALIQTLSGGRRPLAEDESVDPGTGLVVVPRAPEEPAPSSEAAIPKPAGAVPTTALPPSPIVPAVGGPEPRDLEAPETLAIPEALPDA